MMMEILIRILNIVGSLGLFLYGMKLMSEALQRAAGGRLRRTMGRMIATPTVQIASTAAVTATVQSSSAVTVMIVGFVNAGIVNLRQAVGMMMGANLGTTATAWILALFGFTFDFSVISIPLIGLGFAFVLLRRDRYRTMGDALIGFALMLFGLAVLQSAMSAIALHSELFRVLTAYADLGYLSVLLFLLIGVALTAVLQSSSATIVLTIILCQSGWIPFEAGAAMVLGENLGTTLTANWAAIAANTSARRAALFHTLFNAAGLLWAVPLLPWIARGIVALFAETGLSGAAAMPLMLALFHTGFNFVNIVLCVGFVPQFMRLVTWLVPRRPDETRRRLLTLESGMLSSPELALIQAHNEVANQAKRVFRMFDMARSLGSIAQVQEFRAVYERVEKYDRITERVERETVSFLARITAQDNSERTTRRLQILFRAISRIERIGKSNVQLARAFGLKKEYDLWFNQELRERLERLLGLTEEVLYLMVTNLDAPTDEGVERAREVGRQIGELSDGLNDEQLRAAVDEADYKPLAGIVLLGVASACRELGRAAESVSVDQAEEL